MFLSHFEQQEFSLSFILQQVCFSCVEFNVMVWQKKKLSEQCIIPLEAERSARQANYLAGGDVGKQLLFCSVK